MTEQELRAAVAEYDAELAREMEWDEEDEDLLHNQGCGIAWYVCAHCIERDNLDTAHFQRADIFPSIAATMRAMDAAAKAFQEALK